MRVVPLPLQRLYHASIVVRDLHGSAREYAETFGIEVWRVAHHTPDRLANASAYGYAATYSFSTATGSNANGVTFRLVQPTQGFSTFTEFLLTRGEGVHSVCGTVVEEAEWEELKRWLVAQRIPVAQSLTVHDGARHVYLDTRQALGGFFMEVIVRPREQTNSAECVDETWDFSAEIQVPPDAVQRISRVGHFGVVVPNLMEVLPNYARLLGLEAWNLVHFHPSARSLSYSTYAGQPVQHAFLLAMSGVADVTFEVLQSTRGPTDYTAFLERTGGPGIHHLQFFAGLPEEDWLELRAWMESRNVLVLMSGRVRGGSREFYYLDTREKLAGLYAFEVIVSQAPQGTQPEPVVEPDPLGRFALDFSNNADL